MNREFQKTRNFKDDLEIFLDTDYGITFFKATQLEMSTDIFMKIKKQTSFETNDATQFFTFIFHHK